MNNGRAVSEGLTEETPTPTLHPSRSVRACGSAAALGRSMQSFSYLQVGNAPERPDPLVVAVLSAGSWSRSPPWSLADAGEHVTLPQYRALVVIASTGLQGVVELAEAVVLIPPTASRMCERPVRKGLVDKRGRTGWTGGTCE